MGIEFDSFNVVDDAKIELPEATCKLLDDALRRGLMFVVVDEDPAFKYMKTEYHLQPTHEMRVKVYAMTAEMCEYDLKQQSLTRIAYETSVVSDINTQPNYTKRRWSLPVGKG